MTFEVVFTLAAAGLAVYSSTPGSLSLVSGLIGIAIAVEIALIAVSKVIGNKPFLNFAVITSIAFVLFIIASFMTLGKQK